MPGSFHFCFCHYDYYYLYYYYYYCHIMTYWKFFLPSFVLFMYLYLASLYLYLYLSCPHWLHTAAFLQQIIHHTVSPCTSTGNLSNSIFNVFNLYPRPPVPVGVTCIFLLVHHSCVFFVANKKIRIKTCYWNNIYHKCLMLSPTVYH